MSSELVTFGDDPRSLGDALRPKTPSRVSKRGAAWGLWLLSSSSAIMAVSILAAHAPDRVRLLGVFSIGLGLICGFVSARLSILSGVRSHSVVIVGALLMALAGLIGSTCETARLTAAQHPANNKDRMATLLIEQLKQAVPGEVPVATAKPSWLESFRIHLSRRIDEKRLGKWNRPWPEVLWGIETLAGSAAAGWMARRLRYASQNVSEPEP